MRKKVCGIILMKSGNLRQGLNEKRRRWSLRKLPKATESRDWSDSQRFLAKQIWRDRLSQSNLLGP